MLPRKLLQKLLSDEPPDTSAEVHVSHTNRGPGYLSKMLLLEGRSNAWQQMEYKPALIKKRKIIISNSLFNQFDLETINVNNADKCRDLIQALIANYDVYLWPGGGKSLKDARPVSSSTEFWNRIKEISQANNQTVTESLAEQGLASGDYIIIDYAKQTKLFAKMKATENGYKLKEDPPPALDVVNEFINLSNPDKLSSLEQYNKDLTSINIPATYVRLAKDIRKTLPNLKYVEISHAQQRFLDAYLPEFNGLELKLNYYGNPSNGIVFDEKIRLKKLEIENPITSSIDCGNADIQSFKLSKCTQLNTINFPAAKHLTELEITECNKLSRLDSLDLAGIKKLTITKCAELTSLDLSKLVNLEELTISDCPKLSSDIIINSNVRKLTIKNTPVNKISLNKPEQLLEADIDFNDVKQIEGLERASALKQLTIEGVKKSHHLDVASLKSLQSLSILKSELDDHLDFSTNQLNYLKIESVNNTSRITTGPSLKALICKTCRKLTSIDSNASKTLDSMYLHDCDNLAGEITNDSLTELDISTCDKLAPINLNRLANLKTLTYIDAIDKIQGSSTSLINLAICNDKQEREFDASRFPNLSTFVFYDLSKASNIKGLGPKLRALSLNGPVKSVDLSQCHNLTSAEFEKCATTAIDLSSCVKLRSLKVEGEIGSLTGLNSESMENITLINASKYIYDLDFSRVKSIEAIKLENIKIKSLKLSHVKIGEMTVDSIRMPQIAVDLSQLQQVHALTVQNIAESYTVFLPENPEHIHKLALHGNWNILDLSRWRSLEFLTATMERMQDIRLPVNSSLKCIQLKYAPIAALDLETQKALQKITLYDCNEIEKINAAMLPELQSIYTINPASARTPFINVSGCSNLCCLSLDQGAGCNIDVKDCKELYMTSALSTSGKVAFENLETCPHLRHLLIDKKQIPANTEQTILDSHNQSNPVSIFNFKKSMKIDGKTTGKPTVVAKGDFKFVVFGKNKIPKNHYRINIIDDVQYNAKTGELKYQTRDRKLVPVDTSKTPLLTMDILSRLKTEANSDDKYAVSYLEGTLDKNEMYPLPSHQAVDNKDFQIYIDPRDSIDLFWDEEHKQHCMRLKANAATNKVKLACRSRNTDLNQLSLPVHGENIPQLPKDLANDLNRRLNYQGSPVAFVFDKSKSIDERMQLLKKYCRFDLRDLSSQPTTDIDTLCKIIIEHAGVCRHRANAFFMLARLMGVPANIIDNEVHDFVEIPLRDRRQIAWQPHDLGGGQLLDLTPKGVRDNIFDKVPDLPKPAVAAMHASPDTAAKNVPAIVTEYEEKFLALAQEHELKSLWQLIDTPQIKAPLIKLKSGQNPLQVNSQIISQLKEQNFPVIGKHLYIHRPEDFAHFLKPWQFKNGKYVRMATGPLAELIKSSGVLVVNWSNFTPTEIASYKSILDTLPTILGKNVSKNLLVVGLINSDNKSCSAFLSRTKPWILSDQFFQSKKPAPKPASGISREPIDVDLFQDAAWRDLLYGKEKAQENTITLEDGPLITAIRKNLPITIYNPPNDQDFQLLLSRIRDEGKLFYNGEWLKIPEGFTLTTAAKPHKNLLPNVHIDTKEAAPEKKLKRIYLGLYNLYECLERNVYIDGKIKSAPDLLAQYIPGETEIYLTESVPASLWQRLLVHIEEKYPTKPFLFRLAPQVEIENVAQSEIKPSLQDASRTNVIVTNDPDYMTETLADSNTLIVDLTPGTNFSDLIYETVVNEKKDDSLEFNYIEKDVLKALQSESGRKVILNGAMTPSLYHQLLPYLSGEKKIECNGKLIDIKGQLIAVIPDTCASQMTLFEHYRRDFSYNDYLRLFPAMEDQMWLGRINAFYQAAEKLPHRGIDRPAAPFLSCHRLKRMLELLKSPNPMHLANPLKGIFHYDYPRYSEDYAYLNVMAKYYFNKPGTKKGINHKKLTRLLKHIDINSKNDLTRHAWQLMNCLDMNTLISLLGTPFPNDYLPVDKLINVTVGSAFPALTDAGITRLHQEIQKALARAPAPAANQPYADQDTTKQHHQLNHLLRDPGTFLIMLKGSAGVGKTHAIRKLLGKDKYNNENYYEGEKGFLEWLLKGDKPFLIDEGNAFAPGIFDYLKGLSRNLKTIYYNGKEYQLSSRHKIIVTGNPENYPNRYYHRLFQEYGETVYFQKPEEYYLIKRVLTPILSRYRLDKPAYIQCMLAAMDMIETYNPHMVISIRDYENLAMRFITLAGLARKQTASSEKQALISACLSEFAGAIKDPTERNDFAEKLQARLDIHRDPIPSFHRKLDLSSPEKQRQMPPEKAYLIEGIEQDFLMRNQAVAKGITSYYKPAILLEGNPGVGKSTLYKAIIEKHMRLELAMPGVDKNEVVKRWKFYELSAGSKEIYADLKKAFHEGALVILDELNLDENLERVLNQYLTGVDEDGKPAEHPGFMLLASQNPGFFEGRKNLSPALRNRMHFQYMDDYTDAELEYIARGIVKDEKAFLQGYQRVAAKYGEAINQRTFFDMLTELEKQKRRAAAPSEVPMTALTVSHPPTIQPRRPRPLPAVPPVSVLTQKLKPK